MASDYPYSGSNDQQAYRQQQQQQQQQQHQQQQQQHQQQHQSRMPSQQNDQQVSQYNSPQLLQHGNFDPYSAAQFQQYTGGQYTSMQPSSSSSSLQNNENQRFSMVARHPIRGGMPGNALVSPSPARSSSSAKAPRARVNMACVHCRSRKIRCDGNQPMCATCSRLGRACVYENISEQENAAVRDKKKRSRDAKQARLETLNQLGVSMPRQQQSTGMQDSYRQRPYPMFSGAVPSSSVLRSQFQSANAANQGMMPPSFTQQNAQQQYRDRTWQSQTPTTQFVSAPITNEPIPSNHTRRRGATVGGFEKLENENDLQPDPTFWQNDRTSNAGSTASNADLPYTPAMEGNPVMEAGSTGTLYDVIAPRVNSLSQPATPEAAYRFHASILSHELSTNTSTSTGQPSPQENAYFNNAYQGQPSAFSLGPAYQPNMNQNHDNGAGSNSSAGSFSMTPAMQSSVSEDNLYSAGSMYMGRAEQYGNLSSLTPIVNPANQSFQPTTNAEDQFGQSNINSHTDGQNPIDFSNEAFELTEEQRRRSIEDKKMWKKTTNSDAAIARFFARVVAAREGELENNDVPVCGPGGYNIPAWSHNTNLSLAQDTSITSSSASSWSGQEISGMTSSIVNGTNDGQMTGSTDLTGNTGQMGHSNAQTPESGVPVRRGSGLSHLSQASMVPLSANNTPPSDTAGFRNQRPPPLQFDTLPTFAQQHNIAQLTQQDHTSANTFVESPMTTIQGSGTNMSTSFSQQRMQPSVLTPLSGSSSIALQSPTYISSNMSSNHSPGAPTIMNQAGSPLTAGVQQDLTSMSRTFHTPVTELSSHLFAMGHSRGPSEGSSEEKDVFNNQQQQQ